MKQWPTVSRYWWEEGRGDKIAGSALQNVVGAIKMETSTSDVNGRDWTLANTCCPAQISDAVPVMGRMPSHVLHSERGTARKNLFPRRPIVHRRDIEILMSNVIKMLAGAGHRRQKKKIDSRRPNAFGKLAMVYTRVVR